MGDSFLGFFVFVSGYTSLVSELFLHDSSPDKGDNLRFRKERK